MLGRLKPLPIAAVAVGAGAVVAGLLGADPDAVVAAGLLSVSLAVLGREA